MNKRQHKKNIRKQTLLLSRSELARQLMPENHKRRKQRLKYAIRLYTNWSSPIVYKHYKYSDYVRNYNKSHITEAHSLPKILF